MKTLHEEMVEYINLQIEEDESNYFSLNYCKLPLVIQAIKTLNYVDIDFIRNHFGEDTVTINNSDTCIDISTWNLDYMTITLMNTDFDVTHCPNWTNAGIFTDHDDTPATAKEVSDFAHSLIYFLEQINKHYIEAIDSRLKDAFI